MKALVEWFSMSIVVTIDNVASSAITTTTVASITLPPLEPLYRINVGGSAFTDSNNDLWSADSYFQGGQVFGAPWLAIANTQDDVLYQSERWSPQSLIYEIPVSLAGEYHVRLLFAEMANAILLPNQRFFSVAVEGVTLSSRFDITATVGRATATDLSASVNVADGNISIRLDTITGSDGPKLSGIEVLGTQAAADALFGRDPPTTTNAPTTTPQPLPRAWKRYNVTLGHYQSDE